MFVERIILRASRKPLLGAILLSVPVCLILISLVLMFAYIDEKNRRYHFEMQMLESSRAYFNQILITRLWNSNHGGVYVEVSEEMQPNPYLVDPYREFTSLNGKTYTKVNPSYMTRQISELAQKDGKYYFHMTSLKPINPINKPDDWEMGALQSFEKGNAESHGEAKIEGEVYFRYMAPLIAEQSCLTCHKRQGYDIGDVRGGITVNMPISVQKSIYETMRYQSRVGLAVISISAVVIIFGIISLFSVLLSKAVNRELEAEKLKSAIHLASAAAHELRQPMTIISGCSELVRDKLKSGEDIERELEIIVEQCFRMDEIIKKMLQITMYRTMQYDEETEIFDIHSSSKPEETGHEDLPKQ